MSYVQSAVMRFSQYIAAISTAADAEVMQTRSSRTRMPRRLKSNRMAERRPQPESAPMHKDWKDWLALNSIGVFTAVVVALVAFVGVLMRYSL
jgi:hypothetical protein